MSFNFQKLLPWLLPCVGYWCTGLFINIHILDKNKLWYEHFNCKQNIYLIAEMYTAYHWLTLKLNGSATDSAVSSHNRPQPRLTVESCAAQLHAACTWCCCHSNHWREIRAGPDATELALPHWGGCSSRTRADGTSISTVTHRQRATLDNKGGRNVMAISLGYLGPWREDLVTRWARLSYTCGSRVSAPNCGEMWLLD